MAQINSQLTSCLVTVPRKLRMQKALRAPLQEARLDDIRKRGVYLSSYHDSSFSFCHFGNADLFPSDNISRRKANVRTASSWLEIHTYRSIDNLT